MNEIKKRSEEGYLWTVFKGRVYNISPYIRFYPWRYQICTSLNELKDLRVSSFILTGQILTSLISLLCLVSLTIEQS